VLRRNWSDDLINLYGRLKGNRADEQLLMAEGWLQERPNNPELLLALGRLSLRNQLWGKAREYFEASINLKRKQETAGELCRLYAHLGQHEQMCACCARAFWNTMAYRNCPCRSLAGSASHTDSQPRGAY